MCGYTVCDENIDMSAGFDINVLTLIAVEIKYQFVHLNLHFLSTIHIFTSVLVTVGE